MEPYDAGKLRDSALNWALWKALDILTARYLSPLAHAGEGGHNTALADGAPSAQAALDLADSAELVGACRELNDPASPVMRALAGIWAQREAGPEAGLAELDANLARLTPEQGLVVLAVVAQALNQ